MNYSVASFPVFVLVNNMTRTQIIPVKILCILTLLPFISACSTMGYYWEKVTGQVEIMNSQRPIAEVLADDTVSEETKAALRNINAARKFASEELNLSDNNSYKEYADVGRPYVVYTVVATPRFSVKAKEWCFLIVGCLSYRGYFSKDKADEFAAELQQQGLDVYVAGTRAYSTLGWFSDPVLNTMLYKNEAYRVGLIFHELAHQQNYVDDDTAFNEGFATAVEIEGVERWYAQKNQPAATKQFYLDRQRSEAFKLMLKNTRDKLAAMYQSDISEQDKQTGKERIFTDLRQDYARLKQQWQGYAGYDNWMQQPLNNAHLALSNTYSEWVPAFRALLKRAGSFGKFYENVAQLGELKREQRHAKLQALKANYVVESRY